MHGHGSLPKSQFADISSASRTFSPPSSPQQAVPEPMQSQAANSPENGPSRGPGHEEIYRPHISSNGKRDVEVSSQDRSTPGVFQAEDELPLSMPAKPTKRIKLGGSHQMHLDPEYLLVHKVECGQSINHNHHPASSYFLDTPRLFAGDNKASALRGTISITDVGEHLEDNEHISIIIYRNYDCEEYHESIEEGFERLRLSDYGVRTVSAMRPYLFVLRKNMEVATCISEDMTLLSHDLKEAIRNLENLDPRINYNSFRQDHWSLKAPYLQLYHFRDFIRQIIPRLSSAEEQQHVVVLLRYIDQEFEDDYAEADNLFAKGLVSQKHYSKLFGPDETVVTMKEGQPVASVSRGLPDTGHSNPTLYCENWSFDGVFERKESIFEVTWPSTSSEILPIVDLELFPLKYDQVGTKQRLLDRGQLLWNCRKRRYMSYRVPGSKGAIQTVKVYPRYMIDMNMYRQMHPVGAESLPQRDDLGPKSFESEEAPSETFLLTLQTTIQGFGFQDKKWRTLTIEYLHDIDWNIEAFDRLVLKHHKKELVKALVTVHVTASASTDVIEGKGNGLIMLLHGGPGTGKTLTAESVAELTGKPLYRVTCGDIGTNPEDVEKYLEAVLLIGKLWGCIVLLDEADVFLEERSQTDLQRNALVSVFLRVLEYYEGILILTTNRVGTFDEAFKSRIQLAIHYPALEEKGRWEIWSNFINSLDKATAKVDELKLKVDLLSRSKLNGRQIRNTVKTAMQLAEFRKEILDYTHFERVLEVADEFEKYIDETHGGATDDEFAKAQNIRA
ncbi:AAA family ATPase [Rhexocercosporidium sp. MPI-PUGE-AT-0058]|nr:AAA family ATPase [Rhexocercosporidium sp. MPI-PUGE-AT-0058]